MVLPRLALYGALPPSLVPQLLPTLSSEDRRAARLAYYLVQVQLGCGAAGTPTLPPTRGPHSAATTVAFTVAFPYE